MLQTELSQNRRVFAFLVGFFLILAGTACKKKSFELVPVTAENKSQKPVLPPSYDFTVSDYTGLKKALDQAKAGQTVFIDSQSKIDLTGKEGTLILKDSINLVSSGTLPEDYGALLFTSMQYLNNSNSGIKPLIIITGNRAHIMGLRIRGADTATHESFVDSLIKAGGDQAQYKLPLCRGLEIHAKNAEIDHCELYGWSHAAMEFESGSGGKVHDNYIHHNQRYLLGYGISVDSAKVLIYNNLFDFNRHSIAGRGAAGCSYEAYNNTILGHCISYAFDMHGGDDRGDGTDLAGDTVSIHDNTFYLWERRGILINGVPSRALIVQNNKFLQNSTCEAMSFRVHNYSQLICDPNAYKKSGGRVPEYYQVSGNMLSIPKQQVLVPTSSYQ